jgi:hypothetical protein
MLFQITTNADVDTALGVLGVVLLVLLAAARL